MNRQRLLTWSGGLFLVILAVLITAQVVAARPGEAPSLQENLPPDSPAMSSASFRIPWDVIANGGGVMNSTSFKLHHTIGQTAIGNMSSTNYRAHTGFWQMFLNQVFLPLIQR